MTLLGTALRPAATRVMLLGSGELGKEVAIECQRLGVEVIAVDRYSDAPAMHVAHRSHVINMLDGDALRRVVELEKPHYIVPEIEAIATDMLIQLEEEGLNVVPCARATKLTMNREGIRRLAAEELQLPTSTYRFADSESLFREEQDFSRGISGTENMVRSAAVPHTLRFVYYKTFWRIKWLKRKGLFPNSFSDFLC